MNKRLITKNFEYTFALHETHEKNDDSKCVRARNQIKKKSNRGKNIVHVATEQIC